MKYMLGFVWGLWTALFCVSLWVRIDDWGLVIVPGVPLVFFTLANIVTDGDLTD